MIPAIIIVSFLVLFAVVMIAVSLGYRFLETQRKKQVEGMLNVVSGNPVEGLQSVVEWRRTDRQREAGVRA